MKELPQNKFFVVRKVFYHHRVMTTNDGGSKSSGEGGGRAPTPPPPHLSLPPRKMTSLLGPTFGHRPPLPNPLLFPDVFYFHGGGGDGWPPDWHFYTLPPPPPQVAQTVIQHSCGDKGWQVVAGMRSHYSWHVGSGISGMFFPASRIQTAKPFYLLFFFFHLIYFSYILCSDSHFYNNKIRFVSKIRSSISQ